MCQCCTYLSKPGTVHLPEVKMSIIRLADVIIFFKFNTDLSPLSSPDSQIEFVSNDRVSSNLSLALVMNRSVLHRLQERIKELQVETSQERDRTCQVRKRRAELAHERKEMKAKIPGKSQSSRPIQTSQEHNQRWA